MIEESWLNGAMLLCWINYSGIEVLEAKCHPDFTYSSRNARAEKG